VLAVVLLAGMPIVIVTGLLDQVVSTESTTEPYDSRTAPHGLDRRLEASR
jgi:hypothetical protein